MNETVTNSLYNSQSITPTTAPQTSTATGTAAPKTPGKFGRILGGIVGSAINVVAPGVGIIGNFIGRSSGLDVAAMETMMQQQWQQSMSVVALQNQVQTKSQEFTTVSNLLKSKHDSEMSAINNFKS